MNQQRVGSPAREKPSICEAGRKSCHLFAMDKQRPPRPGSFRKEANNTWPWQGTDVFLGLTKSQGQGVSPVRGSPTVLIQKGDWCGSAAIPAPSERKLKVRIRSEHRALRSRVKNRGRATKGEVRLIDRSQLNGDAIFL